MAIQELEIHGFRSLRSAVWKPGPLNLVLGSNGSGKSNLLRLLELIADAARGKLQDAIPRFGGMVPLLWDNQEGRFGWRLTIEPVDAERDRVRDALTFEMEIGQGRGGSGYQIEKDTLANWVDFNEHTVQSPYWIFRRDFAAAELYDQNQQKLVNAREILELDLAESLLSQIVDSRNSIPVLARRKIGHWAIHHDILVERNSRIRRPATTQYVTRLDADGGNLAGFLHTHYSRREFKDLIDDGMRAGFGEQFQELGFPPAAASQIQLAVFWKSSSQAHVAQDLSDGTLRFLFILAALADPDPPSLIAIDEPEAGLHPSMLPVIAEYAVAASERTQVVLTSHSPEFLDCFSSPAVTLCNWEDGQSQLFALDPERLNKWLARYRLGHMFTHGDLDALASPPVDDIPDLDARLENAFDDGSDSRND